jgi:GntR family transcriptional regulator/MocR family aminotransferase
VDHFWAGETDIMARRDQLVLRPRASDETLFVWLFEGLREAILQRRLAPGARVLSSRALAAQYGLARNTVVEVFEQLISEGYLSARPGSGTFVTQDLPDETLRARPPRVVAPGAASRATLSRRGQLTAGVQLPLSAPRRAGRAFRSNQPAVDLFPAQQWARLLARRLQSPDRTLLAGGDARGYAPLRRAVAEHLGAVRAVRAEPEQVLIVSGVQQALDLAVRLLLDPGDSAWVEDPGYPGARAVLEGAGARLVPVPVDAQGLLVEQGVALCPGARLVYVTPARQFPLGGTLPLERRLKLLEWAASAGAWVFEDDYDSEFRYEGRPVGSLQGLDRTGSVLFAGSFNKMLFPSLRLGYLVLPQSLVEPFARARAALDRHPPSLDQAVLCDFLESGAFSHHVRRMREVYAERLQALIEAAELASEHLQVVRATGGLQTVAWLSPGRRDTDVALAARRASVEVLPLSLLTMRHPVPDGLLLGFATTSRGEMRQGMRKLAGSLV